jgi:hypothetical protein
MKELDGLLAEARFPARVQVMCHDADAFHAIRRHSLQADLIFLGLRSIAEDESLEDYAGYYSGLSNQTNGLPPTALVNAGEQVDLHRLFTGL